MSWLARSIANTLKFDEVDEKQNGIEDDTSQSDQSLPARNSQSVSVTPEIEDAPRGVKEDISELTKSLSRQFWGVASFLAPPSTKSDRDTQTDQDADRDEEDAVPTRGIRSDFEEIGGKFKSGISKLSATIPVAEISKMATNLLHFGSDAQDAIGVTEDVLLFVRNVTQHPETWLDFPIPDDGSFDELEMTEAQQEHALAVESIEPGLASLRFELCPGYMNESCFWSIYFVLINPRLNKEDAIQLCSPSIYEARATLSQELKKSPMPLPAEDNKELLSVPQVLDSEIQALDDKPSALSTPSAHEKEKHAVQSNQISVADKNAVEEQSTNSLKTSPISFSTSVTDNALEDDTDNWLKEEIAEASDDGVTGIPMEDDVSFSDLEDEDAEMPANLKRVVPGSNANSKTSKHSIEEDIS